MRTLSIVLLAVAATTAAAQSDEPLEVHFSRPNRNQLAFALSDSAYVAVFSLPWGGSTPTLVYPGWGNGARHGPGDHTVLMQGPLATDYLPYLASADGLNTRHLNTTLVIIASRTPLALDHYAHSQYALTKALGGFQFVHSSDVNVMTERLANLIAPKGAQVTTDIYYWRD